MSEEEKKAIESLIEIREFANLSSYKDIRINQLKSIDIVLNLIEKQKKEIQELKKVIKMVEIYKSYGIPEDAEMVIMRKDDFLRNNNNEFISKDKIREKIKEIENSGLRENIKACVCNKLSQLL